MTDQSNGAPERAGRGSARIAAISLLMCGLCAAGAAQAAGSPTRLPTTDELLDWAEKTFPQFFPVHTTTQTLAPYLYRYYPGTGNYVGLAGSDVYVLGPVSSNQLLKVGTVNDFACQVAPSACPADDLGAYRLLGLTGTNPLKLTVFDPASPQQAVTLQPLPANSSTGTGDALGVEPPRLSNQFSHAYTRSGSSTRRTFQGAANYFYANGGKLYQVSLARGTTPQSKPISSLSTACEVVATVPMDDSGEDVWVYVSVAGADGNCSTELDNAFALVHSNAPSSQAATVMPATISGADGAYIMPGVSGSQVLRDAQGRLQWFRGNVLASGKVTRRLFAANDLSAGPVDNTAGGLFGLDPSRPGRAFVSVSGGVRRMTWTASGTTLGDVAYTDAPATSAAALVSAEGVYSTIGNQLLRFPETGSAQVVASLPYDPKALTSALRLVSVKLTQTPTRVIAAAVNGYDQVLGLFSLTKSGSTWTTLTTSDSEGGYIRFLGTQGEQVVYSVDIGGLTNPSPPAFSAARHMLVRSDGTGRTVIEAQASRAGVLEARTPATEGFTKVTLPEIESLLLCPLSCSDGDLVQYRLGTHDTLVLGHLAAGTGAVVANGVDGLPVRVRVDSQDQGLWMIIPGVAGSLARVTPP